MKQKAPHPDPLPKGEGAGCAASIAPQGEARQHDPLTEATIATRLRSIPAGVWTLGFVSMLMDISSEMIHALLPIYMVSVLGTSTLAVGLIEGIAEATASITKIFSGALSDWLGRRKELAALGYGLAAFTKPVFPLAPSLSWLVGARFVDRIGKGIRGAPRDALVADLSPPEIRGASFGLRQSLDTVGAFAGRCLRSSSCWPPPIISPRCSGSRSFQVFSLSF